MAGRRFIVGALCVSLCVWAGCLLNPADSDDTAGSENDYSLSDIPLRTLQGTVGGKGWTFQSGKATVDDADSDLLRIELYSRANTDPCSPGATASDDYIFFSVPRKRGTYHQSFAPTARTVFFFDGSAYSGGDNAATEGILVIDSVTAARVGIRFTATADEDNHAGGGCVVPLCSE